MKHLKTYLLGLAAGASISLGGFLFVIMKNLSLPNLGGFLFSVGLLLVCSLKFNLYTGKIGYVFIQKKSYLLDLLIMYIGNLCAAIALGYLCRVIFSNSLSPMAEKIANAKISKSWEQLLPSGFFCGVFVYLAVDTFKNKKIPIIFRVIWLILCVAAFVNLGFDHCIANMFYLGFANAYGSNISDSIISLVIVTIGNSLGSVFVNFVKMVNN